MASFSISLPLFFLVLFLTSTTTKSVLPHATQDEAMKPMPAELTGVNQLLQSKFLSEKRSSKLGVCALCVCCGGAKGLCFWTPCCFHLNCNIPNKPFGLCAFTPSTCNCFGCHL